MEHRRRLLEYVVERYDQREQPVTPSEAASQLEAEQAVVAHCLRAFAECQLVAREAGGYRPTVTARELLALDWDGAIVDPCPETGEL